MHSIVLAVSLALLKVSRLVDASAFGMLARVGEVTLSLLLFTTRTTTTATTTRRGSAGSALFVLNPRRQRLGDCATHTMANKLVFFSSITSGDDHNIAESTTDTFISPTISSLVKRAQRVRNNLYGEDGNTNSLSSLPYFLRQDPSKQLCYPSSTYNMMSDDLTKKKTSVVQRGYCNWLLPNKVMIGSYPGMTPEIDGPTRQESRRHIRNMVQKAKITLFCSLQAEVPSQMDDDGWKKAARQFKVGSGESEIGDDDDDDDVVYLESDYLKNEFPKPFTRYGPLAQSFASESSFRQLEFLHFPIEDLAVPTCNTRLFVLLSNLLEHLQVDEDISSCDTYNPTIYLHCWGGRGRAGLVGACLASLLFPELSAKTILDWIQCGYDTRLGAETMAEELTRSPQTAEQRRFVKEFVVLVHAENESRRERE